VLKQNPAQIREHRVRFARDDTIYPRKHPQSLHTHFAFTISAAHQQDGLRAQLTNALEQCQRSTMLLKHGAASNDARPARDNGFSQMVDVSGALHAHPTHQGFSLFEVRREAVTAHLEHQVQVLFVLPHNVGEETAGEAPFAKQMVGGCGLHRLIGHQADGFGKTEVAVDNFATDIRIR
jgi:hypothetical protein